jgi:ketol-acid reductoisomerase
MAIRIIHGESNAPIDPLRGRGRRVAVVGFGNQGSAQSLCMRDSGLRVDVAARAGSPGARRAAASGFEPLEIAPAVRGADLVVMALPDEVQPDVYGAQVAPNLKAGAVVGFLHGFNIRYGFITPARGVGVVMVAPKGPGTTLRRLYQEGRGLPCLLAVHQETASGDAARFGLAWAAAIGAARAGIVHTTFADETETDLFGEQSVLCGGLVALIRAAFETLTAAGYPPELAYLECCHEVKQIADLVYERGPAGMLDAISSTAQFGTFRAGPRIAGDALRRAMTQLLDEVRDGTFAAALRADYQAGAPWFRRERAAAAAHALEPAGRTVRGLMPWLGARPDAPP